MVLVDEARRAAAQFERQYGEPMPVETLVKKVCALKQLYTQWGGQRPFGVKLVFAGYDNDRRSLATTFSDATLIGGFQLYASDPSGTYGGYQGLAFGQNSAGGQSYLGNEYVKDLPLLADDAKDALHLALTCMTKTSDSELDSGEHVDLFTISLTTKTSSDDICDHKFFDKDTIAGFLKTIKANDTPENNP